MKGKCLEAYDSVSGQYFSEKFRRENKCYKSNDKRLKDMAGFVLAPISLDDENDTIIEPSIEDLYFEPLEEDESPLFVYLKLDEYLKVMGEVDDEIRNRCIQLRNPNEYPYIREGTLDNQLLDILHANP